MSSSNTCLFRDWIAPNEVYGSQTFSANPHPEAVKWLKANKSMINWTYLSMNTNPDALKMFKGNTSKIEWGVLSANPSDAAIELLKANIDKIDMNTLAINPNEKMLTLLRKDNVSAHFLALMVNNPNKKLRDIALSLRNHQLANWYSAIPHNCERNNIVSSMYVQNVKVSVSDLKGLSIDYIERLIPLYKDDPSLVDFIEANLDRLRSNGKIEWSKLTLLWSNPAIFKSNMGIDATCPKTELELMNDELHELRDMLAVSRTQFKDIEGRLFKQEARYNKSLSLMKAQEESQSSIVVNLKKTIESQQEEISLLTNQLHEQENENTLLKKQTYAQAEELEDMHAKLHDYETINGELKEKTDIQEAKIEDFIQASNEASIELEILRSENERYTSEIAKLRDTIVYQQQKHEEDINDLHHRLFEQEHDNEDIQLFGCW